MDAKKLARTKPEVRAEVENFLLKVSAEPTSGRHFQRGIEQNHCCEQQNGLIQERRADDRPVESTLRPCRGECIVRLKTPGIAFAAPMITSVGAEPTRTRAMNLIHTGSPRFPG